MFQVCIECHCIGNTVSVNTRDTTVIKSQNSLLLRRSLDSVGVGAVGRVREVPSETHTHFTIQKRP